MRRDKIWSKLKFDYKLGGYVIIKRYCYYYIMRPLYYPH